MELLQGQLVEIFFDTLDLDENLHFAESLHADEEIIGGDRVQYETASRQAGLDVALAVLIDPHHIAVLLFLLEVEEDVEVGADATEPALPHVLQLIAVPGLSHLMRPEFSLAASPEEVPVDGGAAPSTDEIADAASDRGYHNTSLR